MSVLDTLRSPDSRVERTIAFVDVVQSTSMKQQEPETSWIPAIAWLYEAVTAAVAAGGSGTVVKTLGDGVMLAYADDATQALNDAIAVQEAIKDAVSERHVRLYCSYGVATGEVMTFVGENDQVDYLGLVVDRAQRLCSIASAQAILVDTATIASAQLNKVRSTVGSVLRRNVEDYQGELEKANLAGFAQPVPYREIRWDQQLFGLKSRVVTAAIDSAEAPGATSAPRPSSTTGRQKRGRAGTVRLWNADRGQGFIDGNDGQSYYTDARFLVGTEGLDDGELVFFHPHAPLVAGKNPLAACVVPDDEEISGQVVALKESFGFVRVHDQRGNTMDLFMSRDQCPGGLACGEDVTFIVGHSDRGPRAEAVELQERAAMAA